MSDLHSATPPPKFSRYRSVRQTNAPQETIPSLSDASTDLPQRTKSMSRYRRSKVTFQINEQEAPPLPSHQPLIPCPKNQSGGRTPTRAVTDPLNIPGQNLQSSRPQSRSPQTSNSPAEMQALMASQQLQPQRRQETENERLRRKVREFQEREAAKSVAQQKAQKEKEEQERAYQLQQADAERALHKKKTQVREAEEIRQKQIQEAEQARVAQIEAVKALEEQKKRDLERLQRELDAAPASQTPPTKSPKFGFFSRKSSSSKETKSFTSEVSVPKVEVPKQNRENILLRSPQKKLDPPRSSQAPKKIVEVPQQIQQGGGGIVPQIDAPISASNAGERRVLVRCKQSSVNLPVNPETTPKDIIYSAANFMTQNIIPSTAITIECYNQLGLERRVRRYEHVRDVMNTWDRDTQNSLRLENSDTPKFDTDLELTGVPKELPADVTVYMYHSQKPGTWIKRYITLLSTGQVYIHKKADAKPGDKNTLSLCHLSDFDIYSVTPQQLRKVLKAPKKHCYAVKSQQKPAVFLNTENFVHFFSTDDESLAEKWYSAVQSWRSWYLVNKMGGGKKSKPTTTKTNIKANNGGSALLSEVEDEPYMIGTFTSLGLDDFKSGSEEGFDSEDESRPRQIPFHLRNSVILTPAEVRRELREAKRHPPPVSYRLPSEISDEGDFSSSGLLGRSYTTRQANARPPATSAGPFTEGSNLLNRNQDAARANSLNNGIARSNSRSQPKPLLDFTPTFKEAPQWDKTGKGHGVAPIKGVPLVEVATTPENPLADLLPKATIFRRDATTSGNRPATSHGAKGGSVMQRGRVKYDS